MADPPNLLILMADQLTPRALKAYGGSVAPAGDSLADRSVVANRSVAPAGDSLANRSVALPLRDRQ
jgi:arylsulfatase A-like enzyme